MLIFETAFSSPAEHLACDEALLDYCETHESPGLIRFWESSTHFVVLGYGKRLSAEVFEDACERLNIPVLRRASGGGTVVQGPGALNYTLVLPFSAAPDLETITATNRFIMARQQSAVAKAADREVRVQGCTDLTIDGLKFSGNAQRRKKRSILFHGSFLLNFDLPLIAKTLRQPADQPEYRQKRDHLEFLTNLALNPSTLTSALLDSWGARHSISDEVANDIAEHTSRLIEEKYSREDWNRRF